MTEIVKFFGRNTALPDLPEEGAKISVRDVEAIEAAAIAALPAVTSIEEAEEWRRKAKGIEAYLRSPELQRPMLGAQRYIEAKIGQLLGPGVPGNPHRDEGSSSQLIPNDQDRHSFRLLARALKAAHELACIEAICADYEDALAEEAVT